MGDRDETWAGLTSHVARSAKNAPVLPIADLRKRRSFFITSVWRALHVLTALFQRGLVTRVLGDTGLQILMSVVRSSVGLLVCSDIPRDLFQHPIAGILHGHVFWDATVPPSHVCTETLQVSTRPVADADDFRIWGLRLREHNRGVDFDTCVVPCRRERGRSVRHRRECIPCCLRQEERVQAFAPSGVARALRLRYRLVLRVNKAPSVEPVVPYPPAAWNCVPDSVIEVPSKNAHIGNRRNPGV